MYQSIPREGKLMGAGVHYKTRVECGGRAEWRHGVAGLGYVRGGRESDEDAEFVAELHWYSHFQTITLSVIP